MPTRYGCFSCPEAARYTNLFLSTWRTNSFQLLLPARGRTMHTFRFWPMAAEMLFSQSIFKHVKCLTLNIHVCRRFDGPSITLPTFPDRHWSRALCTNTCMHTLRTMIYQFVIITSPGQGPYNTQTQLPEHGLPVAPKADCFIVFHTTTSIFRANTP